MSIHDELVPYFRKGFANRPQGLMIILWFNNDNEDGITHGLRAERLLMFVVQTLLIPLLRVITGRSIPSTTLNLLNLNVPESWQAFDPDELTDAVRRAAKTVVGEAYIMGDVKAEETSRGYPFKKLNGGARQTDDAVIDGRLHPGFS